MPLTSDAHLDVYCQFCGKGPQPADVHFEPFEPERYPNVLITKATRVYVGTLTCSNCHAVQNVEVLDA